MLVIMPDMVVVMQDMSEQRSRRRATSTPRRGGHSRSLRCGCALWPLRSRRGRPETRTGSGGARSGSPRRNYGGFIVYWYERLPTASHF